MNFSWYRVLAVMKKNLTALKRDKRTIALIVLLPIIMMVVFGYAFGTDVKHAKVVVCNLDANATPAQASYKGYNILADDDRIDITSNVTTVKEGLDLVQAPGLLSGDWALIVFPANFTERLFGLDPVPIEVDVDGSNPQVAAAIIAVVTSMLVKLSGNSASASLYNVTYKYGDANYRPVDNMAPAVLGFTAMIFMLLLSVVFNVRERLSGMAERTSATPTSKMEVVMGNLFGYSVIGVVQTSLLLIIVKLLFNVAIVGNVLYIFGMFFVFSINTLALGLFLSAFARNEQQAFQFIALIIIPSVLLSGFVFPIDGFPDWLKAVSYFIPITYIIIILRKGMLAGLGLESVWLEFLILASMTMLLIALAAKAYSQKSAGKILKTCASCGVKRIFMEECRICNKSFCRKCMVSHVFFHEDILHVPCSLCGGEVSSGMCLECGAKICSTCGFANKNESLTSCPKCGASLLQHVIMPEPWLLGRAACSLCGGDVSNGVCLECGAKICSACGFANKDSETTSCPKCGYTEGQRHWNIAVEHQPRDD